MSDERTDLPPLAAGGGDSEYDPDQNAFESDLEFETVVEETGTAADDATTKVEHHPQFVGTGVFWGLVVGVVLAIIVVVFAAQNTQSATIKVLPWDWSSPLFVVVLISLLIGIVLDEIVGLLFRARRRRRLAEKEELKRLRGKR
jgi:uncharacterized integral membrane protein